MKAIKVMGIANQQGQFFLVPPLKIDKSDRVEVIFLIPKLNSNGTTLTCSNHPGSK
jgi:hypothetical protein